MSSSLTHILCPIVLVVAAAAVAGFDCRRIAICANRTEHQRQIIIISSSGFLLSLIFFLLTLFSFSLLVLMSHWCCFCNCASLAGISPSHILAYCGGVCQLVLRSSACLIAVITTLVTIYIYLLGSSTFIYLFLAKWVNNKFGVVTAGYSVEKKKGWRVLVFFISVFPIYTRVLT